MEFTGRFRYLTAHSKLIILFGNKHNTDRDAWVTGGILGRSDFRLLRARRSGF